MRTESTEATAPTGEFPPEVEHRIVQIVGPALIAAAEELADELLTDKGLVPT